jgi:hypothetical protein
MNSLRLAHWFVILPLMLPPAAQAQNAVIRGTIRDGDTSELLPLTNVFIAHTTVGTSSDDRGHFFLSGVHAGMIELVVSRVGYDASVRALHVDATDTITLSVTLKVREVRTEEVEILGRDPAEWREQLVMFSKFFIGTTRNSERCVLLNPHVLEFRLDNSHHQLQAWSDSQLVVENRALGYRLNVTLVSFSWNINGDAGRYTLYPRFEPLIPGDEREEERWKENRLKTYAGSAKHFFASLLHGTLSDELFAVFSGRLIDLQAGNGQRAGPEDFSISPAGDGGNVRIEFTGWLRVDYYGNIPPLRSYIHLEGLSMLVDSTGNILTPLNIMQAGEWAKSRMADLLPMY